MKHKRLIIVLCSILGFVVLCTILSFTLFKTNNISFKFHNKTTIFAEEQVQKEIIESTLNTRVPIFSLNKKAIIRNLESKYPYLKVINIETIFPNKLVLHCAEREELFCIKSNNQFYYICDDELKILRITDDVEFAQNNAVVLNGVGVLNVGASVGDYLELYENKSVVLGISNAFAHNNKNIADLKAMFKSFEVVNELNEYVSKITPTLVLTTYDDFKIYIHNANSFFKTKINLMLNIIPQKPEYYTTHRLIIDINPNNISQIDCIFDEIEKTT